MLSIKPKYVKNIVNRSKKYEFRKSIFKRSDISQVYIYSSSPEKKIVGLFQIGKILKETPEILWKMCKEEAGISKDEFFRYFKEKEVGFALEITSLKLFKEKKDPSDLIPNFHPPQSFCYVQIKNNQQIIQYF